MECNCFAIINKHHSKLKPLQPIYKVYYVKVHDMVCIITKISRSTFLRLRYLIIETIDFSCKNQSCQATFSVISTQIIGDDQALVINNTDIVSSFNNIEENYIAEYIQIESIDTDNIVYNDPEQKRKSKNRNFFTAYKFFCFFYF